MKIIDNKKDYYDYLSGIYGIDDLIVYDRRNSKILKADGTLPSGIEECFSLATLSKDRPKKAESGFNLQSVHNRIEIEKNDKLFFHRSLKEGRIFHFVLEVGMNQYCFEVERWLEPKDNNKVYLDYWLIKTKYDIKSRFSKSPICMAPCSIHTGFFKLEIEWQNQNIDISHFEEDVNNFKENF
ncbi:MAG: hypothetical protein II453_08095 [Alphaproteobacteria bacterium]|nr:hypothetical protein [Alphaproteobacteria bacterium]